MRKTGWWLATWLTLCVQARAQDERAWREPPPQERPPAAYPDQPVFPDSPTFQRRPDMGDPNRPLPNPLNPPLTPQDEATVDRVLLYWEQSSTGVKTFACKFERLAYDPFDPTRKPNEPKVDRGEIRYSAPDKASFRVEGEGGEHWVCDGKAIYELDAIQKQMIVHKLPPEEQGKAIAGGPIPFLFGAKAADLRHRYYLRIITPDEKRREEVWLEVWPRYLADAQNFKYADLILGIGEKSLTPTAVQIHHPNGKDRVVYTLNSIAINKKDMWNLLEDPFKPRAPRGWQTVIKEPGQGPRSAQGPGAYQGPPAVGVRPRNPR